MARQQEQTAEPRKLAPGGVAAASELKDGGRRFQVIKGSVGPFPKGHVFSEEQFREINGVPPATLGRNPTDSDAHYNSLLNRLAALEVVIQLGGNVEAQPIPIGPGGIKGASLSVEDSTKAVIDQRAAASRATGQATPAETTQPFVERPPVVHGGMVANPPAYRPLVPPAAEETQADNPEAPQK